MCSTTSCFFCVVPKKRFVTKEPTIEMGSVLFFDKIVGVV